MLKLLFTFLLFIKLIESKCDLRQFRRIVLIEHNKYRLQHNTPLLIPSQTIDKSAQSWANFLASNNLFEHSENSGYGENLYVLYTTEESSNDLCSRLAKQCVKAWYDEIKYYDYSKPRFSSKTGHFTQVLWYKSVELGVGYAIGNKGGRYEHYCVAQYSPQGNFIGLFHQNVKPARSFAINFKSSMHLVVCLMWLIKNLTKNSL